MQFQSEIELRVKVLDKELDDLEKRMQRVANPFQASGAQKVGFKSKAELAAQKALLSTDRNRLELAQQLNVQRIKSLNLNNSWYKALQQGKEIQLDINKAVAKEAQQRQRVTDTLKRQQATQKKNRRQDILLGAGFPLLFGGGIGQAVAGGLGGAVGGFGGGIAAQAALKAVTDLNNAITETAAVTSSTSAAYDFLTEKQLFSSEETRRLADELAELGRVEELAALATEELVNMIGNEGVQNLQDLDSEWNELLSNIAELGLAIAAFISQYLKPVIELLNNAVSQINTRNRVDALRKDLAGTPAGEAFAERERELRAAGGVRRGGGRLTTADQEALLREFSPQREITVSVPVTDQDRKTFAPPKAKKSGGKSDEDRIRERLQLLAIETAAIREQEDIKNKISAARIAEDKNLENRLNLTLRLNKIQETLAKTLVRTTDERVKQAEIAKALAQAEATKADFTNKENERLAKQTKQYELNMANMEAQIELASAMTREQEKQAKFELQLIQFRERNKQLLKDQPELYEKLEASFRKLFELQNQSPLEQYIRNTTRALYDTEAQLLKVTQTLEGQLASGISNFFTSIIDGSKSAEEAFADMLKGMGQALVQQAAVMIAQYIAIGVARIFAGIGSSSSTPQIGTDTNYFGQGFNPMSYFGQRANGGPVAANTPYIVGERSPELFVPNTAGTIYNQDQMRSAMATYSEANGPGAYSNQPLNINVQTTSINGMEFITPEQFRLGMDQAATQGAKQGEMRAMNRLRQSRSTRNKLGM